jgi:hypothetical protein
MTCTDARDRSRRGRSTQEEHPAASCHGSVLLLTVVLLSLLSVLFLFATNSILLRMKAAESMQASLEMLYIAEAGLAHGAAFCSHRGASSPSLTGTTVKEGVEEESATEGPFGDWHPFGTGEYRVRAFRLETDPQPFLKRDSGILLVSDARLQREGSRRACLLLGSVPSFMPLIQLPPQTRTTHWYADCKVRMGNPRREKPFFLR